MAASKTTSKTPAKRPAAARKAVTAARSSTARASKAAPDLPDRGDDDDAGGRGNLDEAEALEGAVVGAAQVDDDGSTYIDAGNPDGEYYRPDRGEMRVPAGLSFTSEKKDREAEGVGEERVFEVDGEVYVARRPPDDTFVLLSTASAVSTPQADRLASIVEFVAEVVDEADFLRLRSRMKDPLDDFGFVDLVKIMESVVGTFSRDKGPKQARAMARAPRR